MYLGEAKFYEERMNEFIMVAKNLEIKELSKGIDSSESQNDDPSEETIEQSEENLIDSSENDNFDDSNMTTEADIVNIVNIKLQTKEI